MQFTILPLAILLVSSIAGVGAAQTSTTNGTVPAPRTNVNEALAANVEKYPVIPEIQNLVDSWIKGPKTNGLACALGVGSTLHGESPSFYVNIVNTTTNDTIGYLRLPFEAVSSIELFDSKGKSVAKTPAGKRLRFWTQEQIKDYLSRVGPKAIRRKGYFGIRRSLYVQISNHIDITKEFQVEQPGEYSFHLSVRLVKPQKDQSGNFETTLLPEVVTKVHIRKEDIPDKVDTRQ